MEKKDIRERVDFLYQKSSDFIRDLIDNVRVSKVAIDWGSSAFKIISAKYSNNLYSINKLIYQEAHPNSEYSQLLGDIWRRHNLCATNVYLALDGPNTLVRTIDLPKMTKKVLNDSFQYELSKYVPFSSEDVYYDFNILPIETETGLMKVLLAIAKKDFIEERLSSLKQSGIFPRRITLAPIALSNMFLKFYIQDDAPVAILDLGFAYCAVNVINKGMLLMSREIKKKGEDVLKRLSYRLNADISSFAQLKQKDDIVSKEILQDVIGDLIEDIKISLDYLETKENISIRRIYTTGGLSLFKSINSVLSDTLKVDCLSLSISEYFTFNNVSRNDFESQEGSFSVAAGLLF